MTRLLASGLASVALACAEPRTTTVDTRGADTSTGTGPGSGGPTGGGTTGGGTTGGGTTGGGTTTPDPVTRFAVLGDAGKEFDETIPLSDRWTTVPQYKVGRALAQTCAAKGGCEFALYLGDNFYKTGVSSATDPQWRSKFEQPYSETTFPFYPVIGNHDDGQGGVGFEFRLPDPFYKGGFELEYARTHDKWRMPATYHAFHKGPVDFAAFDTNQIILQPILPTLSSMNAQKSWISQQLPTFAGPWRIAFAHHPYISNGDHGNAGNYSGDDMLASSAYLGLAALGGSAQNVSDAFGGRTVKEFVEAHVCGKFDVYFSGHDHSLQDLGRTPTCATEFLVSGGGGSHTEVVTGRNPYLFQSAQEGFVIVEATKTRLVFTFHDDAGAVLHSRTLTK